MEVMTPIDPDTGSELSLANWLNENHWGKVRTYQIPSLPFDHLLPNDVPIDERKEPGYDGHDRKALGDCNDFGGRATSKSFTDRHDNLQVSILRPGEHDLMTSRDDKHLTKRVDELWNYAYNHPLFARLVRSATVSDPYPKIDWYNGHVTVAIIEGTSGQGENYLGDHYHRKTIDEFQLTSSKAWKNLLDASADKGCVVRTTAVSDGRIDTPAHEIRNDKKSQGKINIRPQYVNPYWTPGIKTERIKAYGGENTQEYITNVQAEEGEPFSSVWNMRHILQCTSCDDSEKRKGVEQRRYNKCPVIYVDNKDVPDNQAIDLAYPAPRYDNLPIWLTIDEGYSPDPTIINIWGLKIDLEEAPYLVKPYQYGYVQLNAVEYSKQAKVILDMCKYYLCNVFGIDYTGAGGVTIVQEFEKLDDPYVNNVKAIKWDARKTVAVETTVQKSRFKKKSHQQDEIKIDIKHHLTSLLLMRFAAQNIELLDDLMTRVEVASEMRSVASGRYTSKQFIYKSQKGDHRLTTWRIMEYLIYLLLRNELPMTMKVEHSYSFELPQIVALGTI